MVLLYQRAIGRLWPPIGYETDIARLGGWVYQPLCAPPPGVHVRYAGFEPMASCWIPPQPVGPTSLCSSYPEGVVAPVGPVTPVIVELNEGLTRPRLVWGSPLLPPKVEEDVAVTPEDVLQALLAAREETREGWCIASDGHALHAWAQVPADPGATVPGSASYVDPGYYRVDLAQRLVAWRDEYDTCFVSGTGPYRVESVLGHTPESPPTRGTTCQRGEPFWHIEPEDQLTLVRRAGRAPVPGGEGGRFPPRQVEIFGLTSDPDWTDFDADEQARLALAVKEGELHGAFGFSDRLPELPGWTVQLAGERALLLTINPFPAPGSWLRQAPSSPATGANQGEPTLGPTPATPRTKQLAGRLLQARAPSVIREIGLPPLHQLSMKPTPAVFAFGSAPLPEAGRTAAQREEVGRGKVVLLSTDPDWGGAAPPASPGRAAPAIHLLTNVRWKDAALTVARVLALGGDRVEVYAPGPQVEGALRRRHEYDVNLVASSTFVDTPAVFLDGLLSERFRWNAEEHPGVSVPSQPDVPCPDSAQSLPTRALPVRECAVELARRELEGLAEEDDSSKRAEALEAVYQDMAVVEEQLGSWVVPLASAPVYGALADGVVGFDQEYGYLAPRETRLPPPPGRAAPWGPAIAVAAVAGGALGVALWLVFSARAAALALERARLSAAVHRFRHDMMAGLSAIEMGARAGTLTWPEVGQLAHNAVRRIRAMGFIVAEGTIKAEEHSARLILDGLMPTISALALARKVRGVDLPLTVDAPERDWVVPLPAEDLRRVLENVLSNALKFGGDRADPKVRVRFEPRPGWVTVLVEDHGMGFEAEEVESAFRPYQRGAVAKSKNIQGSGLGLSIVRELLTGVLGTIEVRRLRSPTVVAVDLPAVPEE